jgi:hypothetical protein
MDKGSIHLVVHQYDLFSWKENTTVTACINNINLSGGGGGVWFARITGKIGDYLIGKIFLP